MSPTDRPLLLNETFRIRPEGKQHVAGDMDCPGCDAANGVRYPYPHREASVIKHLEFLLHGERFQDVFDKYCEGGCLGAPVLDQVASSAN
jgi:hypothetical protein